MEKSSVMQYHQMMLLTLKALQTLGGSANIDELDSRVIECLKV